MNKATSRKVNPFNGINPNSVLIEQDGLIYAVAPTQEFCPLKNYSEKDYALLLQSNPSFLAKDAKTFTDQKYLRNLSLLYVAITNSVIEKVTQIKTFFAKDLERAVLKLAKEHPAEYATLCKEFCIDPKRKRALPNLVNISNFSKDPLIILSSWGYAELYSPHLLDVIPKLSAKFLSIDEMSEMEKAKYAHILFLFVRDFNHMPYDQERYTMLLKAEEEEKGETITSNAEKQAIFDETVKTLYEEIEQDAIFEAIMLENAYDAYFKDLPDNYFDVDTIAYWLEHATGIQKYTISLFTDLFYADNTVISSKGITFNRDIRKIKEQIFPYGQWSTGIEMFKLQPDENVLKAMGTAYKKYVSKNCKFGEGVTAFKKEHKSKLYCTDKEINLKGYLYTTSPVRLRISDPNEMKMIQYVLSKRNNV